MPKYQVIYREHNKLNLDTLYIGPFDTWEEAYDALCQMPALGVNPLDIGDDGYNAGCKFVEYMYETFEEAKQIRTAKESENYVGQQFADLQSYSYLNPRGI